MNKILEEKKRRHINFYDPRSDTKRLFHIHTAKDREANPQPMVWKENRQKRVDWAAKNYEVSMNKLSWLNDDFIPFASCTTGTEIFAEAFGCEVVKPADTNPFAIPFITKSSEISKLKIPKLEDSPLYELFGMADELRAKCGADALLGLPDVQTPMDIAALIWDKNYLFIAMVEEPEAVKELAHKISVLYCAFFDEWFNRYGKEFIAHHPDYYMPAGLTVSEDEIGSVGAEIYDELFLPELNNISNRYGGIGIHCCANASHQWAGLKKINGLKLLNLAQPHDTIVESSKFFAGHTAMYPSWDGVGDRETWFSQLDADAHVLLDFTVPGDDEAKTLCEKILSI